MRRTATYGNMPTPCKNVKTNATLQGIIAFFLHLYKLPAIETAEVLSVVNIAELVTNDAGIADCCINVGVRVSKYPRIDTAFSSPMRFDFANLICDFFEVILLIFIFSPHCILIHPYRKLHRKFETIEHLFDLRK